jgi:hypothetical protein
MKKFMLMIIVGLMTCGMWLRAEQTKTENKINTELTSAEMPTAELAPTIAQQILLKHDHKAGLACNCGKCEKSGSVYTVKNIQIPKLLQIETANIRQVTFVDHGSPGWNDARDGLIYVLEMPDGTLMVHTEYFDGSATYDLDAASVHIKAGSPARDYALARSTLLALQQRRS